jgi:uncharacterized protein
LKKTALVTGAASGLGFEFSHLLARDSFDLILIDIDRDGLAKAKVLLEQQYSVSVDILRFDLSKPQVAAEIYSAVKGREIEILINNAGFGLFGFFSKTAWQTEEAMINLHVLTLTHLTKLILNDMLQQKSGRIMNVSSLAAFQPGPLMAIYYATKAYILSFSEALANEVKGTGVTVTAFCPGLTKTGFQGTAAGLSGAKESRINFRTPSPQAVAHYGYKAMNAGKPVAIQGLLNKLTALLPRFVPRAFAVSMVRRIQEKLRE